MKVAVVKDTKDWEGLLFSGEHLHFASDAPGIHAHLLRCSGNTGQLTRQVMSLRLDMT